MPGVATCERGVRLRVVWCASVAADERGGGRALCSVRAYERTSVRVYERVTLRPCGPCGLAALRPCNPATLRASERTSEPTNQRASVANGIRGGVRAWALRRTSVAAFERGGARGVLQPTSLRAYERSNVRAYERASMEEGMCGGVRVCVLRRTTVASVRAWRRTSVLQRTSLRAYEPPSERVHDRAALRPCDPARGGVRVCVCGGGRACEPTSLRAYEPTSL